MDNGQTPDPYDSVLADLKAQRQKIEEAIALLESIRVGAKIAPATLTVSGAASASVASSVDWGPGAFLGMSIVDATKKLLHKKRQPMRTSEIVSELERGGLVLSSNDKVNTVGSILLRRFYQVEDIVRQGRGVWGLAEWHPGRKFPKGVRSSNGNSKGEQIESGGGEVGNDQGTQTDNGVSDFDDLMGHVDGNAENTE